MFSWNRLGRSALVCLRSWRLLRVEQKVPCDATNAAMLGFSQGTMLLAPAEDALDHEGRQYSVRAVLLAVPLMALRRRLPVLVRPWFCVTCGVTSTARSFAA